MDTFTPEEGIKGLGIFPIVVVDQESNRSFLFIESPYQLPGLLSHSEPIRVCSDTSQMDPARGQFDEKEHIHGFQLDRFHGKKVASQKRVFVVRHQTLPTDGTLRTGAGTVLWRLSTLRIAVREAPYPNFKSSPSILPYPHRGFSRARRSIKRSSS